MRRSKKLMAVAKWFGVAALLGWTIALLYFEVALALFTLGSTRNVYALEGLVFLLPIVADGLVLRRISHIQAASNRLDIVGLKELMSVPWAVVGIIVGAVVPGVMMLLYGSRVGRLVPPEVVTSDAVLEVVNLKKYFPVRRTLIQSLRRGKTDFVHAVDDVSFKVMKGEIVGLAGESGSGKTTVLRTALMLTPPTAGSVLFQGQEISRWASAEIKKLRPKLQVVFQDPYESVNPRMTIFDIVAEGLLVNKLVNSREEAIERVTKALSEVQITPPEDYLLRYPHEVSGGQRQRVAIARALVLDPEVILADEPVSMLDVSIRAEVINVLLSIRQKRGIAILMVTHDLALSKDMVDELAIMYLGKIVEQGPAESVVSIPYHPYTHALTAAVPVPDPQAPKIRVLAKGEIPTNISPPSGCRFHPRCPFAKDVCSEKDPPLEEVSPKHLVACHFWRETRDAFSKGLDGPVGASASR